MKISVGTLGLEPRKRIIVETNNNGYWENFDLTPIVEERFELYSMIYLHQAKKKKLKQSLKMGNLNMEKTSLQIGISTTFCSKGCLLKKRKL